MGSAKSNLAFFASINALKVNLVSCSWSCSYHVWELIHDHFLAQTKVCARHLHTNLRVTSLYNKTMCEFLGEIKSIVDELA